KPYVLAAQRHNYKIRIVETPPVDLSTIMDRQQSRTDIHKALPLEVVQGMLQRFEHNVTVDDILNS
ncbi:MAG: hypothetical protein EBU66_18510, partial [Bacteroidetes bacterium]|nr:hypothetical protein [Bacteroidota bacterium]